MIDPLDGTRNYLTAAGPWSVCIALQYGDVTQVAVVHDPAAGETFSAVRGAGATLDGEPIAVSGRRPAGRGDRRAELQPVAGGQAPDGRAAAARCCPRSATSGGCPAALDLCYLAAGRLDGAVCLDTKLWDIAAGLLIAEEAGVVLGGVDGRAAPALVLGGRACGLPGAESPLVEADLPG